MTGKTLQAEILDGWAENLETYSPSQLQAAFEQVERQVAAFPAVSHIIAILDRAEFDAQFAMILKSIRWHGWEWKDREAWKERDTWDFHSAEAVALGDRIRVIGKVHAAEPAPEIPPQMARALELFGQDGDFHTGLKRLWRDSPTLWTGDTERNIGDHSRMAALIDKDLYACWLRSA